MHHFNKDRLPSGKWPFLNVALNGLRNLKSGMPLAVDLKEGGDRLTLTGKLTAYRYATIHRVVDLAEAAVLTWNAGSVAGSLVCCRALLETLATMYSLMDGVEKAIKSKDYTKISNMIDAYALSTAAGPRKNIKWTNGPPRIKEMVLYFIRRVEPKGEQFWEDICNVAHPNGDVIMGLNGTQRGGMYDMSHDPAREADLFVAVYNCFHCCNWLIASEIDFEILIKMIRAGGELEIDDPLIVARNLQDRIISDISTQMGRIPVGPAGIRRKKRMI